MPLATRTRTTLAILAPLLLLGSCIPEPAPSFESESPNARLEAIAAAANATDETSLRKLVAQLDADDPAARLLAITALQKRTGETFGYLAADPGWRRHDAIERWNTYLDPDAGPDAEPDAGPADQDPAAQEQADPEPIDPGEDQARNEGGQADG